MTARDRTVLLVVAALAVLGGFWMLVLSPKRQDAGDLTTQVNAARQRLQTAQSGATSAERARRQYAGDYATVARLGKAVPVDDDVPSLLYQLESAAHSDHIDFRKIDLAAVTAAPSVPASQTAAVATANGSATTTPAAGAASASTAALPPGAAVGSAGFPTMPFTFDFQGSYFDMERFVRSVDELTTVDGKKISVTGRLLTIDGIDLKAGPTGFPSIDATVLVTSYLLPPGEGLTAGATATGPGTGSTTTASASTATPAATASLIGSN